MSAYRDRDDSSSSGSEDDEGAIAPPPSTPVSGDRPVRPSSRSSSRPSSATRATSAGFDSPPPLAAVAVGGAIPRVVSPGPADDFRRVATGIGVGLTPLGRAHRCVGEDRPPSASRRVPTPTQQCRSYTAEELRSRPRSNPRTRTPMRDISPMPQVLNRMAVHDSDDEEDEEDGMAGNVAAAGGMGERVTVRIGAGAATGTAASFRSRLATTPERRRPTQQPRSSRQGPSKRKVRRWNNDRMVGVASELARAGNGAKGERAAEAFLRGEAEAAKFAVPNKPLNYRSEFARMADNDGGKYTNVRERFVRGELAMPATKKEKKKNKKGQGHGEDGSAEHLKRIQPRLRAVLVRACSREDTFASAVVRAFEEYLLRSPHGAAEAGVVGRTVVGPTADSDDVLGKVLLCLPSSCAVDRPATDFYFPEQSSGGGFHRLLLHAVCQFHGLEARSSSGGSSHLGSVAARRICITGKVRSGKAKLLECVSVDRSDEKGPMRDVCLAQDRFTADVGSVAGKLSALEVT